VFYIIIQCVPPLDFYTETTLPLSKWLTWKAYAVGNNFANDCNIASYIEKLNKLQEVWKMVTEYPDWEKVLRDEPRVGYDPVNDCDFFIFKMENNGTTLVISEYGFDFATQF